MMNAELPETSRKYDVAISFLVQDLSLAQALYDKLSEGLEVFFFPHNQEELAGTDGLASMREPFVHQARINVVLYREKWGNTPWTAVEAAAVKDSCLANAYRSLFFFVVEPTHSLPSWLPDTHVRFNYGEFTLEQAVGAIKLRVQEEGGHYTPLTPLKRVELLKKEDAYRRDKASMNSAQGLDIILGKVKELYQEIDRLCTEVNALGHLQIRHETNFVERSVRQICILTDNHVAMKVIWHQQYSSTLDNSGLFVQEYNGRVLLPSEGHLMLVQEPKRIGEYRYEPELSRTREYGWKRKDKPLDFISSSILAEKCVLQFIDLVDRAKSGKIESCNWG